MVEVTGAPADPVPRKRVLLTGAAGRIGSGFFEACGERYDFTLVDRSADLLQDRNLDRHERVVLDLVDYDRVLTVCSGIDTVVHLGADPSPEAGFDNSLLANNIRATYSVFSAAVAAGCARVVFASSIHAVLGHPRRSWPIQESALIWPVNMYGVSKCTGESIARQFASSKGLPSIAIRIASYEAPWIATHPDRGVLSSYLSSRDMNQLLCRCIDTDEIDFAIVHGQSNNQQPHLSLDGTTALLGYRPDDDGYAVYGEQPAG